MLQIDIHPYASDALEDAMRLAQTKALNSYTFSDCLSFLNYVWSDIYSQICCIDSGYYSKIVRVKTKYTKLPPFVKNTVSIFYAQNPNDSQRYRLRAAGDGDLGSRFTYRISGTDLYCPDAESGNIWLEYCPQPSQLFFTQYNRDPKILQSHDIIRHKLFSLYELAAYVDDRYVDITDISTDLSTITKFELRHRNVQSNVAPEDISSYIIREPTVDGQWIVRYISCEYPYIFVSYQHSITGEWVSGFFNKEYEWTVYNPFAFTGKNSNIEYISTGWNDKTGLGVIIRDYNDLNTELLNITKLPAISKSVIFVEHNFEYKANDDAVYNFTQGYWYNRFSTDYNYIKLEPIAEFPQQAANNDAVLLNNQVYIYSSSTDEWLPAENIQHVAQEKIEPKIKELGWTPDTQLIYPAPEVYRYLVARLAEKFSALNESNIMGVQSELADARFAFQAFLKKDKSSWERMINVNPATIGDWL